MEYDPGFFDDETYRLGCAENPIGAKVLPMPPEWTHNLLAPPGGLASSLRLRRLASEAGRNLRRPAGAWRPIAILGPRARTHAELPMLIQAQQERGKAHGEIEESTAEEMDQQTLDELRELGDID